MTSLTLEYGEAGGQVRLAPRADISSRFKANPNGRQMLANALELVTAEDIRQSRRVVCEELGLSTQLTVVANADYPDSPMRFGIHAGHQASRPGMSPFMNLPDRWPTTDTLVLEFESGLLVRVMPGDYYPPLPWMMSARDIVDKSRAFWRTHSYIRTPRNVRGHLTKREPSWWH